MTDLEYLDANQYMGYWLFLYMYMKPELDVLISTEWQQQKNQSQACPTSFDNCRDLFRGKLSINQAIFDNIYLGIEITGDLCGVFDKTDA